MYDGFLNSKLQISVPAAEWFDLQPWSKWKQMPWAWDTLSVSQFLNSRQGQLRIPANFSICVLASGLKDHICLIRLVCATRMHICLNSKRQRISEMHTALRIVYCDSILLCGTSQPRDALIDTNKLLFSAGTAGKSSWTEMDADVKFRRAVTSFDEANSHGKLPTSESGCKSLENSQGRSQSIPRKADTQEVIWDMSKTDLWAVRDRKAKADKSQVNFAVLLSGL